MAGKISTGTLNLRFMQNAHRAQDQQEHAEADKVTVHDEAQWEVSNEVKAALGIGTAAQARYIGSRSIAQTFSHAMLV